MYQAARASVNETSRQAKLAMFAIAAVGVSEALGCAFNDLDVPGVLFQLVCYAAWAVAAILYCRWLYRAYGDVALLDGPSLHLTAREAVVSFFLPFVGLYRPYRALVDLHEASDPRSIRVRFDGGLGTRAAMSSGDARLGERRARDGETLFPVRSWWALWLLAPWVTCILDNASVLTQLTSIATLSDPSEILSSPEQAANGLMRVLAALIHVVLAALAIGVIRSIVARQRERLGRLEAVASQASS
jgi:hypothetical protein